MKWGYNKALALCFCNEIIICEIVFSQNYCQSVLWNSAGFWKLNFILTNNHIRNWKNILFIYLCNCCLINTDVSQLMGLVTLKTLNSENHVLQYCSMNIRFCRNQIFDFHPPVHSSCLLTLFENLSHQVATVLAFWPSVLKDVPDFC